MCKYIYTCMYIYMYVYIQIEICIYIHIHVNINKYIYFHEFKHIPIIYIHLCMWVSSCIYIHTYKYINIYTNIYTCAAAAICPRRGQCSRHLSPANPRPASCICSWMVARRMLRVPPSLPGASHPQGGIVLCAVAVAPSIVCRWNIRMDRKCKVTTPEQSVLRPFGGTEAQQHGWIALFRKCSSIRVGQCECESHWR